jgi:glycosyltransferase involved in cell wall biosynthesis
MKIAIFHNYLENIGGAEIVTLTLARELKADVYTTNISSEKIIKMGFEDVLPRVKSIGKIPTNAPFRQQAALTRFRLLNLKNKYELYIIAGDWAMAGAVNNKPNIWYVHSPIREIWDSYKYVRETKLNSYERWAFDIWVTYNRFLNKRYIKQVDKLICNSINTQNRVKKFLKRNSIVINPPIETSKLKFNKSKGYWLSVNRLIDNKRILMQLKTFSKLPNEKLIIVGSYEKSKVFTSYVKKCLKAKPKNVEIISWVDDKELAELYSRCKGFLTTAIDEDFGMAPVEAMACGKPVIAPNEGGYKESVINGETGILIEKINENKLIEAIKQISQKLKAKPNKYKLNCIKQSKQFSTENFINKIKDQLRGGKNDKRRMA